jgi:hypothetical protein
VQRCKKIDNIVLIIDNYLCTSKNCIFNEINKVSLKININKSNKYNIIKIMDDGIYAVSNGINERNNNSRFSQNILYVKNKSLDIKKHFISSLCFGMILSMIDPKKYILNKLVNRYYISAYENESINIYLPSDIFFTRKKYKYIVDSKITWRHGRPLHPLGQITTRCTWNFLLNEIIQLEISQKCNKTKFSAYIYGINLYPLNSILDKKDYSYNSITHWTKIHNIISTI